MKSLYQYFLKQYKNAWQNLSLRIRIEIVILFIIYFSFFTTRLIKIFQDQLNTSTTTEFGLTQFILHILALLISFTIPLVHINLLPKQKGLINFRTLPLNKLNTFWLVFFVHLKYQLIGFIIILPVCLALLFAANLFFSIYFLFEILLYQVVLVLFITMLTNQLNPVVKVYFKYFLFVFIVFGLYFPVYYFTDLYFLFDPIFFIIFLIYLIPNWQNIFFNWDTFISSSQKKTGQRRNQLGLFSYPVSRKFPKTKILPLFSKEVLSSFRNPKYVRMQIFSFIIYSLLLFFLHQKAIEDFILYSAILTALYIWQHFSLQFNEKYSKADSAVFIKTLPFKYYQLWLAKFFSEFLFVLFLLFVLTLLYLSRGFHFSEIVQPLLILLLFSCIVLAAIINFKIVFFDKPRFAGYAYHFFVIFVSVMSVNYYLIGPIIALALLIYFTFYSYREFLR